MQQQDWLQTLTVGDPVIVDRRYHPQVVRHVERVTATQVLVAGVRYRRTDGFAAGTGGAERDLLRPCTPEDAQRVRWREAQARFVQVCRTLTVTDVAHLSPAQCQALLAQLRPSSQ
jgi:hypothetical protein